jgi:hypothetical protein
VLRWLGNRRGEKQFAGANYGSTKQEILQDIEEEEEE